MRCPSCGADDDHVVDSRPSGDAVRRRRHCNACGQRFSTLEEVVRAPLSVAKRDGGVVPFAHAKVLQGMDRAANGRLDRATLEAAAGDVERSLRGQGGVVTSEQVGLQVLARLRDLDPVAYVRFASVYRDFEDPEDFEQELVSLRKDDRPRLRQSTGSAER